MTALSPNAAIVYAALLRHADLGGDTDAAGFTWRQIYLDNAKPAEMTRRQFAGYLSALQAAGLYRTQGDDCFGLVRVPAVPAPTPETDAALAALESGLVASGAIEAPALHVGQRVLCNGYPGTIMTVCVGQLAGMVEVRVPGGLTCVSAASVSPMVAQPVQQQQANAGTPAPTLPAFDSFVCDGDSVSVDHDGFTITATIHVDHDAMCPWDREDGHGEVSAWTRRNKRPGELILSSDHGSHRFYDYAGTCALARRDGWGAVGVVDGMTSRARAAMAVREDFERLRAWCADQWFYVGVAVTVTREVEGESVALTGEYDHALWGIESDAGSYLDEVAADLISGALEAARDRAAAIVAELA